MAYVITQGRWKPYEHLLKIDEALTRVASREVDRLIIEVPVRHGKSELVSKYLPAWWLGRFPDDQVMLAAYEADFARSWGRKAREVLDEFGPQVFGVRVADQPAAQDWWNVEDHEGVMVTAGVGGALTGKGADLLIIDDPVKNAEAAMSAHQRGKQWEWWQSTASSRLQPGGRVIVVMARWHEDDLAGRLVANQDPSEPWTVLKMPAIAESGDDPLGRAAGAALCPEMFDEKALLRAKRERGAYWFSALYQQSPSPSEGLAFKRANYRYWTVSDPAGPEEPRRPIIYTLHDGEHTRHYDAGLTTILQTVDVAASDKQTADWTVVSTWRITPDLHLLLLDRERQHFETLEVPQFLEAANEKHARPPMWLETFGAGKTPYRLLAANGYPVRELTTEQGTRHDKLARAAVAIAAYERHAVFHPQGVPWIGEWEDELAAFPTGANDDQVDTVAYAARLLPELGHRQTVRQPARNPLGGGIMTERF
jgi:predicted phage terminase large subunit-like protein